ncbi:WD40 repeat domain-containing protein, partial [Schaalia odontolytica]|uniref:WD40 repeat domain-containing protein n=1 Tax=Schaalia odontolytica TaxID=1660 RepID=UPI00359C3E09
MGPLQGHARDVRAAAFSPDGKRNVSVSSDYTIRVWDSDTDEIIAEPLEGPTSDIWSISFSPGGKS